MNSVVKNKKEKEIIKYPCLMINKVYGFVVLMTKYETGTVIANTDKKIWDIGHYSENWNMLEMEPFDELIILEN